jgi:hypothetical protein
MAVLPDLLVRGVPRRTGLPYRPPREIGRADEVWLVRPDAHLAWRGRPASGGLTQWLQGALQDGRAQV